MRSTRSIRRKVKTWFFFLLLKHVETVAVYSYAEWLSDLHINFLGKKKDTCRYSNVTGEEPDRPTHPQCMCKNQKTQISLHIPRMNKPIWVLSLHMQRYADIGWSYMQQDPRMPDLTIQINYLYAIIIAPMRHSFEGFNRQTAPIQMRRLTMSHLIRIHTVCPSQHTNPQHKRSERRIDGRLSI